MDIGKMYHGLSSSEYHSHEAISRSDLMYMLKSPLHFKNRKGIQRKRTSQMILGELVHCLVLEPQEFHKRYFEIPKINRRTKEGRDFYNQILEQNQGLELLDSDLYTTAQACAASLTKDELLSKPLTSEESLKEVSIFFEDDFKTQYKSRPDVFYRNSVCDVKTTSDASYRSFQKSAVRYGYFLQAYMSKLALQACGLEMEKFIIYAVETEYPFATAVYVLDEGALLSGEQMFLELSGRLRDCDIRADWEDYGCGMLSAPSWSLDSIYKG